MTIAASDLNPLSRASGALAMLAIDQREALRAMFARDRDSPVSDAEVTEFKLAAIRELSPYASAVLLDKRFVLDRALEVGAVDEACAVIAAADDFIPSADEYVADTRIDESVDPVAYRDRGVRALKLLVIYRPDENPDQRIALTQDFIQRCRKAGLISIIEPVSRAPRDARQWDWNAGVLAAARELGRLGADVYKAEVPRHGVGDESTLRADCAAINDAVDSAWVVLSTGVEPQRFPEAVRIACAEGASGFLCGRAVWSSCVGRSDYETALRTDAVARLRRLCDVADTAIRKG